MLIISKCDRYCGNNTASLDNQEPMIEGIYLDTLGKAHQLLLFKTSESTIIITDEDRELIGMVEFSSEKSAVEKPQVSSFSRSLSLASAQYVSQYNVWSSSYSYFYEQSFFRVTFYGSVIIPLLQSTLASILASLVIPKKDSAQLIDFVYGLAVGTIGYFSSNKYTYYWEKYYSLNVFCPILGRPQFRFYSSSSYATMLPSSTFVTPQNTAEWYGGTPYDFTQPAQCRDLVLQYP